MTASQWFSLSADLSLIALLLFLWARLAKTQAQRKRDAEKTRLHHQIARIQQADARPRAAGWPSRRVS